jgi:hypothetical protein
MALCLSQNRRAASSKGGTAMSPIKAPGTNEVVDVTSRPKRTPSADGDHTIAATLASVVVPYVFGKKAAKSGYSGTPAQIAVEIYFECLDALRAAQEKRKAS